MSSTLASTMSVPRTDGSAQSRPWCFPWLTLGLLACFVIVFALEQKFAVAPGTKGLHPALATLVAVGGLAYPLVASGEAYRLLSAPFLHSGLSHLLGNAFAFAIAGYSLERLCGRAWSFCIFAAGGMAGSAMSLMLLPRNMVSVGASGGILAMLAALFVVTFRLPASRAKSRSQRWTMFHMVPALIPFSTGRAATPVDYGAHFGGFLFGTILGLLLLATWEEDEALPSLRNGAAVLAVGGLLAVGVAGYAVAAHYPSYRPQIRHVAPAPAPIPLPATAPPDVPTDDTPGRRHPY